MAKNKAAQINSILDAKQGNNTAALRQWDGLGSYSANVANNKVDSTRPRDGPRSDIALTLSVSGGGAKNMQKEAAEEFDIKTKCLRWSLIAIKASQSCQLPCYMYLFCIFIP